MLQWGTERNCANEAKLNGNRHYLLANSGVNADETMQDINNIKLQSTYEPYSVAEELDIEVIWASASFTNIWHT